ncbi:hypothetical protein APHAL10511_003939 [Amanita phalloides]|nr:hypothetical protein APHAL10511_003939 [Amanita phalloides]
MSLAYHSAADDLSAVGLGWVLKGAPMIERVPATLVQDGFRGVVNYDAKDRFALDGQRLMKVGDNEYRFEIEQWSKIVAKGSNAANPDSWEQHLPDGTIRTFGTTSDSNIKALGQTVTRVWAVSEIRDTFSNYTSFTYNNDTTNGSFYLSQISSGGNRDLSMNHQRRVDFTYEDRPDKRTKYLGGYKICVTKRLASIASYVQSTLVHTYRPQYDLSPLSNITRIRSLTLADPSGASVRPLKFNWIDGQTSVFEPTKTVTTISTGNTNSVVFPLDVAASGHSDIVIASNSLDKLNLSVYKADGQGNISNTPSPGSGSTGLPYPVHLFPVDVDGDGKVDLIHISKSETNRTYTITVLLSTADGYKAQTPQVFKVDSMSGQFSSGDFEGNGRVGLLYVYDTLNGGRNTLKFIQFTSNGSQFAASDPRTGPPDVTLNEAKVIVGDFNGNGAQDVFVASRINVGGTGYFKVGLIESQNGTLTFRTDDPFASSSGKILWTENSSVLPFSADSDSKTSLLIISNNTQSKLQMQGMRSTGVTLIPDNQPTVTDTYYDGNVTTSRSTSTNAVNLLNLYDTTNVPKLNVFLFDSEKFNYISTVEQPSGVSRGSMMSWADLRGIARVDCIFGTMDTSGNLTVRSMPCRSTNSQPVDYIAGYETGLGTTVATVYAPLSDSSVYTASGQGTSNTTAAVNALARNASSSKEIASTRSELVHFPYFVVKQLTVTPLLKDQSVREVQDLTYANARLEFAGRGWLGFETIKRTYQHIGAFETSSYPQQFPFIGQVSKLEAREVNGSKLLQTYEYPWQKVDLNGGKNVSARLPSLKQTYYEGGTRSHDVNVSFEYDDYENATKTTITCSQTGTSPLVIRSTYGNDTQRWVIGSKTSEIVEQNNTALKKIEYTYVPGTLIPNSTKNWIADSKWSSKAVQFDKAGNQTLIQGPKSARMEFGYDATYSYITSAKTSTDASHALQESATYDLTHGKALSVTDANGYVTQRKYDVLGRLAEVSEGDKNSISVSEKQSYHFESNEFFQKKLVSTGLGNNTWTTETTYFDGLGRAWRTENSRPDDLSKYIYSISKYDGGGRLIASSRNSIDTSQTPLFTTYEYDTRSRVVKEVSPPLKTGASSVTTTYLYSVGETVETRLEGSQSPAQVTTRKILYLPNPEYSADKLVTELVANIKNPLDQNITTAFDGLGRSTVLKDPAGVELLVAYDGLSRQTERRLKDTAGGKIISHFTVLFDDDNNQATVRNQLTNSTTTSTTDFASRVVSRTETDETISFVYDDDTGTFTKGRLFKASSSKGYTQQFDYDIRGSITKAQLVIDGQTYLTSSEWTPAGQLLKATNPDGTILTRTLLPDGQAVGEIVLTNGSAQASTILSQYDNPFQRALSCKFGNGIVSQSTLAGNGMLTKNTLKSGSGTLLLEQSWDIQDSGRIGGYKFNESSSNSLTSKTFQYDLDGQLINDSTNVNASSFSYDQSGNISSKYGDTFVNEGWQLTTVKDASGSIQSTFDYSVDGNITGEKDGSGTQKRVMKYDTQNRLTEMNGGTFTYDFTGRLIKTVSATGETTIYPSMTYEVRYTSSNIYHTAYIGHGYRRASITTETTASGGRVGDAKIHYFHNDHLGSTVAASDVSGKIITKYEYDSFGKVASQTGEDVARYKFQGKELFGNIYNFGARFFDPYLGRFLTLDNFPISLAKITPSTFNMYSFARNDPINFIDFNGNAPWWHWLVDALLIVAGVIATLIPIPGVQILGAGLLGAGISGLMTDITSPDSSDASWGIDIAIGFGLGLLGGAAGVGVDAAIGSSSVVKALAAKGFSEVAKIAARTAARVVVNSIIGGITNVAGQMITNARQGERWDKDLGQAFGIGFGLGFLTSSFSEAVGFFGVRFNARGRLQTRYKMGFYEIELPTISSSASHSMDAGTFRPLSTSVQPHAQFRLSVDDPLPPVRLRPDANSTRQVPAFQETRL